jgi:hypothetical protein
MKLTNSDFGHILATLQEAERAGAAVNRRRHSRLDLVGRVTVCDAEGRTYTALSDNICFSGVQLLQAGPPPIGARQLILTLERDTRPSLDIRCTIRHAVEVANGLYKLGCEFDSMVKKED